MASDFFEEDGNIFTIVTDEKDVGEGIRIRTNYLLNVNTPIQELKKGNTSPKDFSLNSKIVYAIKDLNEFTRIFLSKGFGILSSSDNGKKSNGYQSISMYIKEREPEPKKHFSYLINVLASDKIDRVFFREILNGRKRTIIGQDDSIPGNLEAYLKESEKRTGVELSLSQVKDEVDNSLSQALEANTGIRLTYHDIIPEKQ